MTTGQKITKRQNMEVGVLVALAGIVFYKITGHELYFIVSVVSLIVVLVAPILFKPLSFLWFGLSGLLGAIVPKILLTLVFFLLVVPVGLVRKIFGRDTLQLQKFKKGKNPVMHERNYTYAKKDFHRSF